MIAYYTIYSYILVRNGLTTSRIVSRVYSGILFIPVYWYTVKYYSRFPGFPLKNSWKTGTPGEILMPFIPILTV